MLTPEETQFVPIGFGFIDHCMRKLPSEELYVYLALRRFVWRGKYKSLLTPLYQAGYLCCSVSQSKIGEMAGVHRTTVNERLAKLKERGWVQARKIEGREELVYVLGERVKTGDGKYEGEVFYADADVTKTIEGGVGNDDRGCSNGQQGVSSLPTGGVGNHDTGIYSSENRVVNKEVMNLCAPNAHTNATEPSASEKPQRKDTESRVDAVAKPPEVSAGPVAAKPAGGVPSWAHTGGGNGHGRKTKGDLLSFDEAMSGGKRPGPPVSAGPRVPKAHVGGEAAMLCGYLAKLVKESTHFEGIVMQAPTGKELALAKRLVENFGMEQARKMVECLALDWFAAKAKWRLYDEVPSMVVVQVHANDLALAVKSGEGVFTPVHRCSEWASREADRRVDAV